MENLMDNLVQKAIDNHFEKNKKIFNDLEINNELKWILFSIKKIIENSKKLNLNFNENFKNSLLSIIKNINDDTMYQ